MAWACLGRPSHAHTRRNLSSEMGSLGSRLCPGCFVKASRPSEKMCSTTTAAAAAGESAASSAGSSSSSTAVPVTTVWDVEGQPTEVIELRHTTGEAPEVQLLVIPGNPGAAPFYTPFMQSLRRHLGGGAAVATVSNLGMDGQGLAPPGRVYSLEDQIRHKLALMRQHFVGPGRPPLVLLGHSIGTYMAIHAVHRLEQHHLGSSSAAAGAIDAVARREWEHPDAAGASLGGMQDQLVAAMRDQQQQPEEGKDQGGQHQQEERQQPAPAAAAAAAALPPPEDASTDGSGGGSAGSSNVVKIIGLYPFLQVDPDCASQRRLQRITPHHSLVARLAGGLGGLPPGARRALVRLLSSGLDPHAVEVTAKVFTTPSCVENGLYMGMTEFETLAAPADWWLVRQLGPRFAVFVAPNDTWFKVWKWDAMHREVPGVESHWVDSQTHAFCVSVQQSEDLAAKVAPVIKAALQLQPHEQPAPVIQSKL